MRIDNGFYLVQIALCAYQKKNDRLKPEYQKFLGSDHVFKKIKAKLIKMLENFKFLFY